MIERLKELVTQLRFTHIALLALALIAVPTLFTIFATEASDWSLHTRFAVAVVWLVAAVLSVVYATWADSKMRSMAASLSSEVLETRRQLNNIAFSITMRALSFDGAAGFPAGWDMTAYVYDQNDGKLKPTFPSWSELGADPREFEPGRGATGHAWEREEVILVSGDAVSNTDYGLTEDQQARWSGYRRAAAYPLFLEATEKFGVLTLLSKNEDDFFAEPAGRALLQHVAHTVALVMAAFEIFDAQGD